MPPIWAFIPSVAVLTTSRKLSGSDMPIPTFPRDVILILSFTAVFINKASYVKIINVLAPIIYPPS